MSKTDANDYSRFNDIDDSDDEKDSTNKSSEESKKSLVETISTAVRLKDGGNEKFKNGELKEAKAAYEDALAEMKDFHDLRAIEVLPDLSIQGEVKNLVISLRGNLAMVAMREESWSQVVTQCNHALQLDSNHVKSLFRRGSAQAKQDYLEEAQRDLRRVIELEATNNSAKKELQDVLKRLKDHKAKEKSAFGSIFSKGSVYDDKEKERRAKEQQRIEARMKEEREWSEDNVKRVEAGLEERTLEDYRKALEEEAKKKKDDETFSSSDDSDKSPSTNSGTRDGKPTKPAASKTVAKSATAADDETVYDEEEAKILAETKAKGYCYFRTSKTDATKVDFTPKTINTPIAGPQPIAVRSSSSAVATNESKEVDSNSSGVSASTWNYAGTWEERDLTTQVKTQLTDLANRILTSQPLGDKQTISCKVSKVCKVEGEAQIIMARGKKRHVFDFQLEVDIEVAVNDTANEGESKEDGEPKKKKRTFKGSLSFPDISPQSSLEYTTRWKKPVPAEWHRVVNKSVVDWFESFRDGIHAFEAEYSKL